MSDVKASIIIAALAIAVTAYYQMRFNWYQKEYHNLVLANKELLLQQEREYQTIIGEMKTKNAEITLELEGKTREMDEWEDTMLTALDSAIAGMQSVSVSDTTSGEDRQEGDTRTAAERAGEVLGREFHPEISKRLIGLVRDAEAARQALGECISWGDGLTSLLKKIP